MKTLYKWSRYIQAWVYMKSFMFLHICMCICPYEHVYVNMQHMHIFVHMYDLKWST